MHCAALSDFIERSPTPWHAGSAGGDLLAGAGFIELGVSQDFDSPPEKGFVVRDGSLVAWSGLPAAAATATRMIGAHTDSPGLRIRPRPDTGRAGLRQLAVEVYGGALINSWLDRDLTLAGRVTVSDGDSPSGLRTELVHPRGPLLRVPQLAVHLDRDVNTEGLKLNPQQHLKPVWGLGSDSEGDLREFLAELLGLPSPESVLGWDLCAVDTQAPDRLGRDGELFAAPRLDDLCCSYGALEALMAAPLSGRPSLVVLNDHEEVGSSSSTGADGAWFAQVLERLVVGSGGDRSALLRSLSESEFLSADMAHGTHPNYPERHEPNHWVTLGGGPVIKHNANQRYATDGEGGAAFKLACANSGVPFQEYSHRGDIPCGSTIGPVVAAGLAIRTIDVGMPQLSMHSVRELMAVADIDHMVGSFSSWLAG